MGKDDANRDDAREAVGYTQRQASAWLTRGSPALVRDDPARWLPAGKEVVKA